jgi:uncharacterized protein (TIGR03437 family)
MLFQKRLISLIMYLWFLTFHSIAQVNILTANYDGYRTNSNPSETILTPSSVRVSTFGKVGSFPVDGQVYAQPLFVGGVQIPGLGTKNVVYVVTMNDSVYAIDADAPGTTTPLWQVNLGSPVPSSLINLTDIVPWIGILSTPVIDPTAQVLYAVSDTLESGLPQFQLHALSLLDGHEMLNGPIVITASIPVAGGAAMSLDPSWHLQRPGLALANGAVYIGFGAHADLGNYHGWLISYDASNLQNQLAVFNTTPSGNAGGIWQAGRGPVIDNAGNLYVVSGNGDFDGVNKLGGAVIKLSGSTLSVLDWFAPADWAFYDNFDVDVGSAGSILIPSLKLLVVGDKAGNLYNLSTNTLGGIEMVKGAVDFQASPSGIFQFCLWQSNSGPLLYQHPLVNPLTAYAVGDQGINQTPVSQSTWIGDSLFASMAVSSNGGSGGIIWETEGDHSQPGIPGTLHAFNASDLTQELWNSDMQPGRDVLGAFAKFAVPLIANGRVYVPTFSNQLVIYGLLGNSSQQSATTEITAVLNGASLIQTSVSRGEVLSIFGTNLGPAGGATMQLDASGHVTKQLAGTQVLFDGIPAPLLYVSPEQVNTVVPFEVVGPVTQVVLQYNAQQSSAVATPVAAASPALFSLSGAGNGQAAIVNADGTINSPNSPSLAGSVVSLFATGLGLDIPDTDDGTIAQVAVSVPAAVSVSIGGQPANVRYVGAAPGLVAGVFQINVVVPATVPAGTAIAVSIQVNDVASENGITIAVH